ncbi:MAG: hypothetical protein IKY41_07080 [Clostridia bacterium]|nr:hypothetical protein [Clostridia bacterium]
MNSTRSSTQASARMLMAIPTQFPTPSRQTISSLLLCSALMVPLTTPTLRTMPTPAPLPKKKVSMTAS